MEYALKLLERYFRGEPVAKYANIIVDISHEKLDKTFQYLIPEELAEDLEYYIEILDGYYSFKIKAEVDGKFVLAGNASVVNKALDK